MLRLLLRGAVFAPLVCAIVAACVFPFAGRLLIVETPVQSADVMVVLSGSRATRWMEALALFKEGVAPVVLLSNGQVDPAEVQLNQRGVYLPREADAARNAMIRLGVPPAAVEVWGPSVDNTAEEARVARAIAEQRGWKRVLVVTSKYHTRRSQYAFERAFRGSGIVVSVRGTRYENVSPARWWRTRYDARWVGMELPKLIGYVLGLAG